VTLSDIKKRAEVDIWVFSKLVKHKNVEGQDEDKDPEKQDQEPEN